MTEDTFWEISDMLDWSKEGNDENVLFPVIYYLSKQSDHEIFEFENIMSKLLYNIDSKEIAKELYGTTKYFSADLFLYQRCVAIINGKEYYNSIFNRKKRLNPNREFESILYVPMKAWAKKHQKDPSLYSHIPEISYETCSNQSLWNN